MSEYDRLVEMRDQILEEKRAKACYFFDTDCDGHWYLIPDSRWHEWKILNLDNFDDDDDLADLFNRAFAEYRIGGHPNSYTFTDPREEQR